MMLEESSFGALISSNRSRDVRTMALSEPLILNAQSDPASASLVSAWLRDQGHAFIQARDLRSLHEGLRRRPVLVLLEAAWNDAVRLLAEESKQTASPPVLLCGDPSDPESPPVADWADGSLPMPPGGPPWQYLVDAWLRAGQRWGQALESHIHWRELADSLHLAAALVGPAGEVLAINRPMSEWANRAGLHYQPGARIDQWLGDSYGTIAAMMARARWSGTEEVASLPLGSSTVQFRVASAGSPGRPSGRLVVSWAKPSPPASEEDVSAWADSERIESLERNARLHSGLIGAGPRPDAQGLRSTDPDSFCQALEAYEQILELALDRIGYRGTDQNLVPTALKNLADHLGRVLAGPRDVVELHGLALRRKCSDAPNARAKAYLDEGRYLVVELMGRLASYYRARAIASQMAGSASAVGQARPAGEK